MQDLQAFVHQYVYIVSRDYVQQFIYDAVRYTDALNRQRQPPLKYVEDAWRTIETDVKREECSCDWVPRCSFHGSVLDEIIWKASEVVKVAVDSGEVRGSWQDSWSTIISRVHSIFRNPMDREYSELRLAAAAYAHWMVHHKTSFRPEEIFSDGEGHTCTLVL